MYNGSFYYLNLETESIVRYELSSKQYKRVRIPRNQRVRHSGMKLLSDKLYQPQQDHSYVDFSSDENGLWAIFGLAVDNNTVVMKFDEDINIQYMWNISLSHLQVADMFIVCGVLYGVDHVDVRSTKIRFALDLYKNIMLEVDLPFTNPFEFTTTLGYNPRLKSLTTWDGGNQLTYPVKYHDIGYKEDLDVVPVANTTGFQIHSAKDTGLQVIDFPQKDQEQG